MGKILFIINTFPNLERPNDGAFNLRAAKQLSLFADLQIVHLRAWHPKRKLIDYSKIDDFNVLVFAFPLFAKSGTFLFALQMLLYKKMFFLFNKNKLKGIKLIHSVGASFSGVVGSYVAKKLKIKHIAQCIGSDINFKMPKLKNKIGVKRWKDYVDYYGCNSKELSIAVKKLYPEAKTEVIYRGVDLNEFIYNNVKYDNIEERIIFLFLGGLSYRSETTYGNNLKGGITLLKAWKSFIEKSSIFAGKVQLLFGGPGITKEKIIKVLGTDNLKTYSINILGQIDKHEVKIYMRLSHVVIIPSMAEGLPNVAMEAAASGCAIIASDVGGTHEVVIDGINGKLIDAGDVYQLVKAIKFIYDNKRNLHKMGSSSRMLAEKNFSKDQFANGYNSLYEQLLND